MQKPKEKEDINNSLESDSYDNSNDEEGSDGILSEEEEDQEREFIAAQTEQQYQEAEPETPTPRLLTIKVPSIEDEQEDVESELEDSEPEDMLKQKVAWGEKNVSEETMTVGSKIFECLVKRNKVIPIQFPWEKTDCARQHPYSPKKQATLDIHPRMREGLMRVQGCPPAVSYKEHYQDYKMIKKMMFNAAVKSFCYYRLNMLELKFNLFKNLYAQDELKEQHTSPRDFYNCRKVDNHVHLSSAMNQKHLLSFMKRKLKEHPDDIVLQKNGKSLSLSDVFSSLNLTAESLSVDSLEVHAGGGDVQHRFDKFTTSKYNPFGLPELREVFLKTDNHIKGRYFAEICQELFTEIDESRYLFSEPRVSVYGRSMDEWSNLSAWVIDNKLHTFQNIRWMIQIPRLFWLHKRKGMVKSFQQMLENIFTPIFEATLDPESHPKIAQFLEHIVAFDHVDDESKSEGRFHSRLPAPHVWNTADNPHYAYYNYYIWANINILNQLRQAKGLNTFAFRPHSGEAGDPAHLISAFLTADSIAHGINLRKSPLLQYLFYLAKVGLSVSPLSNNHLFLNYGKNPFPNFFNRGLNVCLSSDDPLIFHITRDPLIEEFACAAQVFHLSNADLCEIARTSVLQSGLSDAEKKKWISPYYYRSGVTSNNLYSTNVPQIRIQYRHDTMLEEHLNLQKLVHLKGMDETYDALLSSTKLLRLMKTLSNRTQTPMTQGGFVQRYEVAIPNRPQSPWKNQTVFIDKQFQQQQQKQHNKREGQQSYQPALPQQQQQQSSTNTVSSILNSVVLNVGYFSLGLVAYQLWNKFFANKKN